MLNLRSISQVFILLGILLPILISGCAQMPLSTSTPSGPARDGAPNFLPDLNKIPNARPKPEPKARYGNHSPYEVLGKTYRVMNSAKGYEAKGIASWYGTKFHGKRTSSWEPYSMYKMTAAHKTLPLPTYLEVTNLENKRKIIVKVNDRGPFHSDRILDLSYVAAHKLGFADKGTAPVKIRAITFDTDIKQTDTPKTKLAQTKTQPESTLTTRIHEETPPNLVSGTQNQSASRPKIQSGVYVQAGAFKNRNTARNLQQQIQAITRWPVLINSDHQGLVALHRVQVGPLDSEEQALMLTDVIRDHSIADPLLIWH